MVVFFAQLINSGELSSKDDILDYVAYTSKIGELACRLAWQSVLVYDQECRAMQAAGGFGWACIPVR